MTRDDILRMAREAEIIDFRDDDGDPHVRQMIEFLQRFAALVVAAEREECAQLVETEWSTDAEKAYGDELAAAIRQRGRR